MPIPWTLQRYIFREMGKTFLLAAIALTGVLGLGGGVRMVIQLGEVTPGQLIRLIALALPLAATLALPVAALFSAAATYGRLAADNEFVACRSGGINLHVLFLPGLALSIASAMVTFILINFIIPGMTKSLNDFATGEIGVLVQQRLKDPRGFTLGKYRLTADGGDIEGGEGEQVTLRRVAFVEVDGGEWLRYGTADALHAQFDRADQVLRMRGWLSGLTFYDREKGRFVELAGQSLAAEIGSLFGMQIKFLNLVDLLHYWRVPQEWREAAEATGRLRAMVLRDRLYQRLWEDWSDDHSVIVSGSDTRYEIRGESAVRLPRDGAIEWTGATIEETRGDRPYTYRASRAVIDFHQADKLTDCGVKIEAYDVSASTAGAVVRRTKEVLGPVQAPPDLVAQVTALATEDLLEIEANAASSDQTSGRRRANVGDVIGKTSRTITSTLHERFAFSLMLLVLVVLAAALGIILRGSHVVAAFGISFVPALVVIVTIMMGKQMAQNAGTHLVGLALIWSGIALVGVLDWWTLARVLRR